jgi:pilus assembly protein CpaB
MNLKAVIPLALAVILGLVAAVLVRNALAHRDVSVSQPSNLVTVVAAKQDIDPGRPLTADDLVVSKVPAESAPGQVFSDPAQLTGRVPTTPLVKGQTILETLLAPVGSAAGLAALVPPGMRAFTIDVNDSSSVGGMLVPGCRVDVLTALRDPKTESTVARTILQNIKVTAVGRTVSNTPPAPGAPPAPPANNITLLVTPQQAQVLELASLMGRPWLVLRSGRDQQADPVEGTSLSDLRGDAATATTQPAIAASPAPATQPAVADATTPAAPTTVKHVMEVLHGETEADVTFVLPAPAPAPITAGTDTSDINR